MAQTHFFLLLHFFLHFPSFFCKLTGSFYSFFCDAFSRGPCCPPPRTCRGTCRLLPPEVIVQLLQYLPQRQVLTLGHALVAHPNAAHPARGFCRANLFFLPSMGGQNNLAHRRSSPSFCFQRHNNKRLNNFSLPADSEIHSSPRVGCSEIVLLVITQPTPPPGCAFYGQAFCLFQRWGVGGSGSGAGVSN